MLCMCRVLTCSLPLRCSQARLSLEVQRLTGELGAAERRAELLGADLAAQRDAVAAKAGLLECKVMQRWPQA